MSTSSAPTRAAGTINEPPGPTTRAAIGPARKATNAIGPDAAVAKAMSTTAVQMHSSRVRSTGTPKEAAESSPCCSSSRARAWERSTWAATTTAIASGATWSDEDQAIYAINAFDDALYLVDSEDGTASFVGELGVNFGAVGIELHPANNTIYGCTNTKLYTVDQATGAATFVGPISDAKCNNLAAPYTEVKCPEWEL